MLVLRVAALLLGGLRVVSAWAKEPLLDVDYIHDANNPLDNFEWNKRPTGAPASLPTTPPQQPADEVAKKQKADEAAAAVAAAAAAEATEAASKEQMSTLAACITSPDRKAAWFSETAVGGTPCVFGVDSRDEGKHCIVDAAQRYGEFGWCWTRKDMSEWGSCSEACPNFGPAKKLVLKVNKLASVVGHWRDLIAQQKSSTEAASGVSILTTAMATTTPPPPASSGLEGSLAAVGALAAIRIPEAPTASVAAPVHATVPQQISFNTQWTSKNPPNQPGVPEAIIEASSAVDSGRPTGLLASRKKAPATSLKDLLRLAARELDQETASDIALFEVSTVLQRASKKYQCAWMEQEKRCEM